MANEAEYRKIIKEKDKEIEELRRLLERKGDERTVRPATIDRSTSTIRDLRGDHLRALVREVVREEFGGMEGVGREGRGVKIGRAHV